ncbi:MAG: hypothetical protein IPG04_29905 [Polyangiaceae bacterium]|nr:hypothetical protein [Polyangiaceae bacterium]
MTDAELGFWQTLGGAYLGARIPSGPAHAVGVLTLASAESHDDPSFVLGTMAVLPAMDVVTRGLQLVNPSGAGSVRHTTIRNTTSTASIADDAARNAGAADSAYSIASRGGKHHGYLKNYRRRPINQLESSQRSLQRHIERHEGYIDDPKSKVPEWDTLTIRHQESLLAGWAKEILDANEQISILDDLIHLAGRIP